MEGIRLRDMAVQHSLLSRLISNVRVVAICMLAGMTTTPRAQPMRCVDAQGVEQLIGGVARGDATPCIDASMEEHGKRAPTFKANARRDAANAAATKRPQVQAAFKQDDDRRWLLEQELAYQRTIETHLLESRIASKPPTNDDDAELKRARANIASLQREIARLDPR